MPDQSLLKIGENLASVVNLIPSDRGYRPMPTSIVQDATLDEACRGAISIQYYDRTTAMFAGDRTKLYEVTAAAATDVSRLVTPYDLSGSIDPYWAFTSYGETVLAANITEPIQKKSKADANFSDLIEAPNARHITTIGLQEAFIAIADVVDGGEPFPNRVDWNEPGDPLNWTPGVGFAGNQILEGDGGPIISLLGGEVGIIFQERAVWTFEFVGQPQIFVFRRVLSDHGMAATRAAAIHNDKVYYINRTGFYSFSRGGEGGGLQPIGAGRVDTFFWDRVDLSRLEDIVATSDETNDLIIWSYPTQNAAAGVLTEALVYSPIADQWGFIQEASDFVGIEFLLNAYSATQDSDDLTGLIDAEPLASELSDSVSFVGSRRQLMGFNQEHKLIFVSGGPRPASALSGLIRPNPEGYALVNKMRSLVESPGIAVRGLMTIHDDLSDPGQTLPVRDMSRYGFFEYRTARPYPRARYFQFGVEIDGGWAGLNGVSLQGRHIKPVGERS